MPKSTYTKALIRAISALIITLAAIFMPAASMAEKDVKVIISSISTPTDLEGRLKERTPFCIFKFKYKNNFFNVNLPEKSFKKLNEQQKEQLIDYLIGVYNEAFEKSADIFGHIPEGYRFNITFGKTKSNNPFNRLNITDKISNVFPNCLPYETGQDVLTGQERGVMLHEIGHGLFGIMVGTLRHPKTRAFEEGFVDHIAGRGFGEEGRPYRIEISEAQAERMQGLTQLDIDRSIWGDEIALRPSKHRGYAGITHHAFGIEFIDTFIEIFGKENLSEFLIRLRSAEDEPSPDDYGTGQVIDIFTKMGFSPERIQEFENKLHRRLKKNVFKVSE